MEICKARAFKATERYVCAVEKNCSLEKRKNLLYFLHDRIADFCRSVDAEVLNCGRLRGPKYEIWKQKWITFSTKVLDGYLKNIVLIRAERRKLNLGEGVFEPSQGTLRNLQSFLVATCPAEATGLEAKFEALYLPSNGFKTAYCPQPVMKSSSKKEDYLMAFFAGSIGLVLLLVIALFIPKPTDFQYLVFRIILALAAAAFARAIPGIIEINISKFLKAGGAIAVFAIVYFYSPANLVVQSNAANELNALGTEAK